MKQFIYLPAICLLALTACTGSFKKSDGGLEYKMISSGSGKTVGYGNFIQVHIKTIYSGAKDTVLMDTHDFMSQVQVLDSVKTPPAYYKILKNMRKGDSLIIRILTDTIFKDPRNEMPPFMKKGKYLYTHVTLVNFFESRDQADSANRAEAALAKPKIYKKQLADIEKDLASKKAQLETDSKIIEAYLAKNNIKATKTKWGTYVVISAEGIGEKMTNSNIAVVNYTGRTLDSGRVFDSNTDPNFKHVQPYEVNLSEMNGVILGWTDALMQLKKGTKATIYIPSSLAYGANGNGRDIKPNDNLIFDIEVVDAMNEEAYAAKQKAMQEEMMKKMQESQKTQPGQTQNPADAAKKPGQ
jgi:FKBP-type peptidyl-prolyl cis-trans isomerase